MEAIATVQAYTALGIGQTPAEFAAYFREERERWARVIAETGAKID